MPARGLVFAKSIFPGGIFPAVRFLGVLSALFPWTSAAAQAPDPSIPPYTDSFQQTVHRAGVIFAGTVTGIQCEFGRDRRPTIYRISFRVQQGVRGVQSGSTFAIREWAGLWLPGLRQRPRYRVGEHVFVFLYPTSAAGLTSIVGGWQGKLEVADKQVIVPPDWTVRLGWLPTASARTALRQPVRVPVTWLVGQIAEAAVRPSGTAATTEGGHAAR